MMRSFAPPIITIFKISLTARFLWWSETSPRRLLPSLILASQRDFCDKAKLGRADFARGASHTKTAFCSVLTLGHWYLFFSNSWDSYTLGMTNIGPQKPNTRYIHESFTSNVTRLRIPASHGQRQSASVVKDLISKDRQQTQLAARVGLWLGASGL